MSDETFLIGHALGPRTDAGPGTRSYFGPTSSALLLLLLRSDLDGDALRRPLRRAGHDHLEDAVRVRGLDVLGAGTGRDGQGAFERPARGLPADETLSLLLLGLLSLALMCSVPSSTVISRSTSIRGDLKRGDLRPR
jgi:hypothetical protein